MFRFTIRDVLWLPVVVGLSCALATSWQQTVTQRRQTNGWRRRAGALETVLKDAGLPTVRLHDLRHTCATLLLEQGVAARVVTSSACWTTRWTFCPSHA